MSKNWSYREGKALISAYANRMEEYSKTRKKAHFWANILTDLEALNVLETPTTTENVEVKWQTLYRDYKNAKDRGTGSSPSKFLYLKDMDEIFSNDPAIPATHSLSVGAQISREASPSQSETSTELSPLAGSFSSDVSEAGTERKGRVVSKRRKWYYVKKLELQREYYAEKLELRKKNMLLLEQYLRRKENDRAARYCTLENILNTLS